MTCLICGRIPIYVCDPARCCVEIGNVRYGVAQNGTACGMVYDICIVWYGMVWCDVCGVVRFGTINIWYDTIGYQYMV